MTAPLKATVPNSVSFDPLDMRNYTLEKLPSLPAGPFMEMIKKVGVPLAVLFFCAFHFQFFEIQSFAAQTKVPASHCYTMLGIFGASLILWISEAIPNYLTSIFLILAVVFTGILKKRRPTPTSVIRS